MIPSTPEKLKPVIRWARYVSLLERGELIGQHLPEDMTWKVVV
jgi:hypothetical protein